MNLTQRILVAAGIIMVAVFVAGWLQSRRRSDAPTQRRGLVPEQVDRADFAQPDTPWLVAVFTSDTCAACENVADKASVLACDAVAVQTVSYQRHPELQTRYDLDSVPSLVIADSDGVVRWSVIGPVTATDLWAAMAEVREPGSIERGACDGDH